MTRRPSAAASRRCEDAPLTESAAPASGLFTSADYLEPLAASGCVIPESGWTAVPLQLSESAQAPCYLKTHSWGEFVFDFQIAQAYEQQGLAYYPKLVCCVPFTPVPGPRLLAADDRGRAALAEALLVHAGRCSASSVHVLYPAAPDRDALRGPQWLTREQMRYLWRNRDYGDFDAFVAALSSKRRKNLRRERRQVADAGFEIGWRRGDALSTAEWRRIWLLYANTYRVRGQQPYLNLDCLQQWAARLGERMQFCLAQRDDDLCAMAFFFRDGETLYGRHWGASVDEPLLHFELCYYRGIEYAISQGLQCFDAGVQGEHKLLRGFDPERAYSMHHFRHHGMQEAIARYFERERVVIGEQISAYAAHSAYRDA